LKKKTLQPKFKKKGMSRPQPSRVVPGPLSSELELIAFLRHYARVRTDAVCKQPVDASRVTVWVFKKGRWLKGQPINTGKPGSLCQNYFTAMMGPTQYDQIKKELFAGRGLTGVYKHRSEPLYAVVYRPSGFNKAALAALAGGVALAGGLGVAYNKYATPKTSTGNSATKNAGPTVVNTLAQLNKMRTDLIEVIDDTPRFVISKQDLQTYCDLLAKYINERIHVETANLRAQCSFEQYKALDPTMSDLEQQYEEFIKLTVNKSTEQTRREYSDVVNNITPNLLKSIETMSTPELVNAAFLQSQEAVEYVDNHFDGKNNQWNAARMAFSAIHAVKSNDPKEFKELVTKLSQETRNALIPIVESLTSDSQYLVVLYDALGDAERNQITRDKLMAQQKMFLKNYPGSSIYPNAASSLEKLQLIDAEELNKCIIDSEADARTRGIQALTAKRSKYCELGKKCAYTQAMNVLIQHFTRERDDPTLRELTTAKLQCHALLSAGEINGLKQLLHELDGKK
jgi:hypothetical protein